MSFDKQKYQDIRNEYVKGSFNEDDALAKPEEQFKLWFDDAISAGFKDPNAVVIATADKYGAPSARMTLLKEFDEKGFVFYTNYESKKAADLAENPQAAMLFFWDILERQVRIEGKIEKVSKEESEAYFKSRPYQSRVGAWASKQSKELKSRFTLMKDVAKYLAKFPTGDVPLPEFWGGYRLIPHYFEFWQGRESRLHDRIIYKQNENGNWEIKRLYP